MSWLELPPRLPRPEGEGIRGLTSPHRDLQGSLSGALSGSLSKEYRGDTYIRKLLLGIKCESEKSRALLQHNL